LDYVPFEPAVKPCHIQLTHPRFWRHNAGKSPRPRANHRLRRRLRGARLVDMWAFIGEPGAEHRETIETATLAAGGVTTIVARPDRAQGGADAWARNAL
jgi:hypothetical protein